MLRASVALAVAAVAVFVASSYLRDRRRSPASTACPSAASTPLAAAGAVGVPAFFPDSEACSAFQNCSFHPGCCDVAASFLEIDQNYNPVEDNILVRSGPFWRGYLSWQQFMAEATSESGLRSFCSAYYGQMFAQRIDTWSAKWKSPDTVRAAVAWVSGIDPRNDGNLQWGCEQDVPSPSRNCALKTWYGYLNQACLAVSRCSKDLTCTSPVHRDLPGALQKDVVSNGQWTAIRNSMHALTFALLQPQVDSASGLSPIGLYSPPSQAHPTSYFVYYGKNMLLQAFERLQDYHTRNVPITSRIFLPFLVGSTEEDALEKEFRVPQDGGIKITFQTGMNVQVPCGRTGVAGLPDCRGDVPCYECVLPPFAGSFRINSIQNVKSTSSGVSADIDLTYETLPGADPLKPFSYCFNVTEADCKSMSGCSWENYSVVRAQYMKDNGVAYSFASDPPPPSGTYCCMCGAGS